jgi:DNA-binding NtrC family response regulator
LNDEQVFRADLFYRINTVEITLPPLRERREDIPLLLEHFIAMYAHKYNMPRKRITAAALDRLCAYDWPGNIRALRHAVERAVILSEGTAFEAEDFPINAEHRVPAPAAASGDAALDLDTLERDTITRALAQHNGNVSRAAQALGLTRASLYRRMQKHGL